MAAQRSPIVRTSILFGYYNNSDTIASNCAGFRRSWTEDNELPMGLSTKVPMYMKALWNYSKLCLRRNVIGKSGLVEGGYRRYNLNTGLLDIILRYVFSLPSLPTALVTSDCANYTYRVLQTNHSSLKEVLIVFPVYFTTKIIVSFLSYWKILLWSNNFLYL